MNLGDGKKKINKSRGGKNSWLGGKKKLSLESFGHAVGFWRLARVCFFCAFAFFYFDVKISQT
jgi:hypothetical protein